MKECKIELWMVVRCVYECKKNLSFFYNIITFMVLEIKNENQMSSIKAIEMKEIKNRR